MSDTATLSGAVDLKVPHDLVDLLAPESDDDARVMFDGLFAEMVPRADDHDRGVLVDGLLAWRRSLLDEGLIMHGVVLAPADPDDPDLQTPVHWHLLAGVVDIGRAGEIDAGEVGARFLGQELGPDRAYTESFDTDMGWGVGLITEVPVTPPAATGDSAPAALPSLFGLAAGLSAPRDSRYGLLVIGLCLDLERTLEMAAIVAMIAGCSIIRTDVDDLA